MTQALQALFIAQHEPTGQKTYDLLCDVCEAKGFSSDGSITDATISLLQGWTDEEWVDAFQRYQIWRDGLRIELSAQGLGYIRQGLRDFSVTQ